MNAIVLHGSPRAGGNSDTLAGRFLAGLAEAGEHEVRHFQLNGMSISGCQGCEKCLRGLPRYCAVEDDMQQVYEAFRAADIVVFATPMYWGYMTGQMKLAVDRMEAVTRFFPGKTFVVLMTYRHHCESTAAFFKRVCPFFRVELHVIACRTTDDAGEDIPIARCPDRLEEARALGLALGRR